MPAVAALGLAWSIQHVVGAGAATVTTFLGLQGALQSGSTQGQRCFVTPVLALPAHHLFTFKREKLLIEISVNPLSTPSSYNRQAGLHAVPTASCRCPWAVTI